MDMPDVAAILNQSNVIFCVDTNILVEFKLLSQITWRELAPNATEIRIIVPTKVGEEMDANKKKTGRLRRRALEFAKIARVIEESPDDIGVLGNANPRITIEFGPVFRRTELDADLYELDDDDGRVLAEVAKIMETRPTTIFLSDDAKPIRLAKLTKLPHRRPMEAWRREEGPDERDVVIEDLRRALGPQPVITINFPDATDGTRRHILEAPPKSICVSCVDGLVKAVLSVDPQVPRDVLIQKHGVEPVSSFHFPKLFTSKLTHEGLDRYETEYDSFKNKARTFVENLPGLLTAQGIFLPISIEIGNEGNRAAERIHLEAELQGNLRFVPVGLFEELVEKFLEPPDPPEPEHNFAILTSREFQFPEARRADQFYMQDEPDAKEKTTYVSWRCEELRQGTSHKLTTLVLADGTTENGAMMVRAGGAILHKTISVTAPLTVNSAAISDRFCAYLSRHIEVMPQRYLKALDTSLKSLAAECTCGKRQ